MGWRRLGTRLAVGATVTVVILMAVYAVIAFRNHEHRGSIGQFNACLSQNRFLALDQHVRGTTIDTIEDRGGGAVVGEVTINGTQSSMLGGAAAENDGFLMSTATPAGRGAIAIEGCWDRTFQNADS